MSVINRINYKIEGCTETYAFALSMFSKSSIASNIIVFEDMAIVQMGIEKTDP